MCKAMVVVKLCCKALFNKENRKFFSSFDVARFIRNFCLVCGLSNKDLIDVYA